MPRKNASPERQAVVERIKTSIREAGSTGLTAEGIAKALGLITEGVEISKEDRQEILSEIRGYARQAVRQEGWSRGTRDERNVLYSSNSPTEAEKTKAEELRAKRKAKKAEKAAKKAELEEAAEDDAQPEVEADVEADVEEEVLDDDEVNFDDSDDSE